MKGWVGLVGWPIADGLPTLVVTHQLQVERRTGKVSRPETYVLPLCHATNSMRQEIMEFWDEVLYMQTMWTSLQTDNLTNTSSVNVDRPDALHDAQPTVSKHWMHNYWRHINQPHRNQNCKRREKLKTKKYTLQRRRRSGAYKSSFLWTDKRRGRNVIRSSQRLVPGTDKCRYEANEQNAAKSTWREQMEYQHVFTVRNSTAALSACKLTSVWLRSSIDSSFLSNRLCMKLFKTGSIDICQSNFATDLPSCDLKRQDKFILRYSCTVNGFCQFCNKL